MKGTKLHEKVINETLAMINLILKDLGENIFLRRILRSDSLWYQRRSRRNVLEQDKNKLNWKWLFRQCEKNRPEITGREAFLVALCLDNVRHERIAFLINYCDYPANCVELSALEHFYRKTIGHPLKGNMLRFSLYSMVVYSDSLNQYGFIKKDDVKMTIKDAVNESVMQYYLRSAPFRRIEGSNDCESNYYLLSEYMRGEISQRSK